MSSKEYFIDPCGGEYMVKYREPGIECSIQLFTDQTDANDFMVLLRYGVAPWTASMLITGQSKVGKEFSPPPHEKTYRERFGS